MNAALGMSQLHGAGSVGDTWRANFPSGHGKCEALRLPPYGRDVVELIARGVAPNVYIFAGASAWSNASERIRMHGPGSALVLPPNDDVELYRWPAVSNGVLLDARLLDYQSALRIAHCIVGFGTAMIFVLGAYASFEVCTASWCNPCEKVSQQ